MIQNCDFINNPEGDILPPENYRKYPHRFAAPPSPPPTPDPPGQKTDIFGRRYTPRSRPCLWKLSYKLNHPKFQKLQEKIQAQRQLEKTADDNSAGGKLWHT